MAREGILGTELSRILRAQNAIIIPMVAGMHGMRGVADKYICHPYWRGWCELKAVGKELEPHQRDFIRLMVERGDQCCAVRFEGPKLGRLTVSVVKSFVDSVGQSELCICSMWCNEPSELLKLLQWMQAVPREGYWVIQWKVF